MGTVRVDGALLRQKVSRNLVRRDPDMVGTCEVDVVDRAILLRPVVKLDEAVLLRNVRYGTNNWVSCKQNS